MFRLLYISRSQLPAAERDGMVQDIVEAACRRNPSPGITGILVFTGENFAQLLEGDEPAVRLLMTDIVRDRRHREVQMVIEEHVATREYGHWSMAYWGRGSYAERLIENVRYSRASPTDLAASAAALLAFMKKCAEEWAFPQK